MSRPFKLREVFKRGLRREADESAEKGLKLLYNYKPSERGLVAIETPSNPTSAVTIAQSFPLPAILSGSGKYYYFGKASSLHKLHLLDDSWAAGSDLFSSGVMKSMDGSGTNVTSTTSSQYTYAERDDVWFISSGDSWFTNAPIYAAIGGSYASGWAANNVADGPVPRAICLDEGRFIAGGFKDGSSWWDSGIGLDALTIWSKYTPDNIFTKSGNAPDQGCIIWGLPGGGESDIPYTMELCLLAGVQEASMKELLLDVLRKWEMGFSFIPWEGGVSNLKKLGNDIVVYGDRGIGIMSPRQDGHYSIRQTMKVGIAAAGAVAGTQDRHIFLDSKGYLWEATAGPKFERLGWYEFMQPLVSGNPVISYDSNRDDYYISTNSKGYILTTSGLAECRYRLQSVVSYGDNLYGTFATGSDGWIIETSNVDMDTREVKTHETLELGKETLTDVQGQLFYKAKTGAFLNSTLEDFGDAGILDIVKSGIDFRGRFECATHDGESIPYANMTFREGNTKRGVGGYVA